jgi:hypothetical protein
MSQFRLHLSQEQDHPELFLRECDVPCGTYSFGKTYLKRLDDVPHRNGKRDQVRRRFRKLCQEIPQKPTQGYELSTRPEIRHQYGPGLNQEYRVHSRHHRRRKRNGE